MSELPRIMICTFEVLPSPTATSRRIAAYLDAVRGEFSTVVLSSKTPDLSHIERYREARLLRVPVGTGDLESRARIFDRAVRRQVASEEYAAILFTDALGGLAACELRASFGFRLIHDAHRFLSQDLPDLPADRRRLAQLARQEQLCLLSSDQIITGSELTKRHIASLGVQPERVTVIPAVLSEQLLALIRKALREPIHEAHPVSRPSASAGSGEPTPPPLPPRRSSSHSAPAPSPTPTPESSAGRTLSDQTQEVLLEEIEEIAAEELAPLVETGAPLVAEDQPTEQIDLSKLGTGAPWWDPGELATLTRTNAEAGAKLDPWFAQLAHGYCPPDGVHFSRHTPPTNFPGKGTD